MYGQRKNLESMDKYLDDPDIAIVQRPTKEDFCRVILFSDLGNWFEYDPKVDSQLIEENKFPGRPVPLKDVEHVDLSKHHVASLEHAHNVYRLYYYGDEAKGVFRGDDMLVCESIPKDHEWDHIVGFLLYDKNEYDKALKDWHSYWDWMKFRNSSRWVDQEKGLLNYDAKNMCHCMRLMMASEGILLTGEPIVRFEGEQLNYLMRIRRGELSYEELMEDVNGLDAKLRDLYSKSNLPDVADRAKLDELYRHLLEVGKKVY